LANAWAKVSAGKVGSQRMVGGPTDEISGDVGGVAVVENPKGVRVTGRVPQQPGIGANVVSSHRSVHGSNVESVTSRPDLVIGKNSKVEFV
jgi:hypothetical protein